MYDNLSQKIKSYVRVFTIVVMALVLAGGIAAAIILIRRGGELSILLGLGLIFFTAVLDILLYYLSCFAYGFGEMLEQQATQISLQRQLLGAMRDLNAAQPERPAPPVPQQPPVSAASQYPPYTPYHNNQPQRPAYPYPARHQPADQGWPQKQPAYGPYHQNYRTQTPYGTSTGFNEDYHYEPKR